MKQLLGRAFDIQEIDRKRWFGAILLSGPLILLLCFGAMVLLNESIPPPLIPLVVLPAVFPTFFLLAACEELGWMGYAFEPMLARHGALLAALLLGMIWACWHLPFYVFMLPDRIILSAQLVTLVGARILIAWVFENTGKSVFAAIAFHAADNSVFDRTK